MTMTRTSENPAAGAASSQVSRVVFSVLLVYTGQMALTPVIAPLARELQMVEWQLGVTVSTAAVAVVVMSQFWGRRAQAWGAKRVLVTSLTMATTAMVGFTVVAVLGLHGLVLGVAAFVWFLLLRGIGFGAAIAAVMPTAQAYVAKATSSEEERVKGMSRIGAAQGLSMILGALLGGMLASFGLSVALIAVPLLPLIALAVVGFGLRRDVMASLIPDPPRVSPRDPRVWPFLVAGFGMFTALGFIQMLTGFLVQDRFGLGAEATGLATGGAILLAGIGMVIAQGFVVPRSGWPPATLLRVGSAVATAGFVLLIPHLGAVSFGAALLLIGLGLGIATPGYTAGPSLLMRPEEQGGMAGLIGSTNGLTFVVAPTLGTALYGISPLLPIIAGAVIMAIVVVFVCSHPRFSRMEPALAPQ